MKALLSPLLGHPLLSILLVLCGCIKIVSSSNHHGGGLFSLGIRDSFMVAHSFHGHKAFGPAGGMHGATYTCDVEFSCSKLQEPVNWVMDIGLASSLLAQVLAKYNLKNLDVVFSRGEFTTTEFMCRQIHEDLCKLLHEQQENDDGSNLLSFEGEISVKLFESHKAWATYRAPTATPSPTPPPPPLPTDLS